MEGFFSNDINSGRYRHCGYAIAILEGIITNRGYTCADGNSTATTEIIICYYTTVVIIIMIFVYAAVGLQRAN
jgi:hypothetical protein